MRHNWRLLGKYLLVAFLTISQKVDEIFHSEKWSELCSSRPFQRRTTFHDILENNLFLLNYGNKTPDDSVSRVDSISEGIMSVSLSIPEIFDVKDLKNALRHNCNHYRYSCNHYVIIAGILLLVAFFAIYQKVDEIFSFWKVIWILLINTLPAAYDFSWYLRKYCFPQLLKKNRVSRADSICERSMSVSLSVPEIFGVKDSKNAFPHNGNHYVIIIVITS